jgi:hypothetical protein
MGWSEREIDALVEFLARLDEMGAEESAESARSARTGAPVRRVSADDVVTRPVSPCSQRRAPTRPGRRTA